MAKFSVETKNKDSDVKTEGKDWKFSTIYIIAHGGGGRGGGGEKTGALGTKMG